MSADEGRRPAAPDAQLNDASVNAQLDLDALFAKSERRRAEEHRAERRAAPRLGRTSWSPVDMAAVIAQAEAERAARAASGEPEPPYRHHPPAALPVTRFEVEVRQGNVARAVTDRVVEVICDVCGLVTSNSGAAFSHARSTRHRMTATSAVKFAIVPLDDDGLGARS